MLGAVSRSARPSTMVAYRTMYLFAERLSPVKNTATRLWCFEVRGGLAVGNFVGGRRL